MKNNFALFQNPCRDVAMQRLYIQAMQRLYIQAMQRLYIQAMQRLYIQAGFL
ncbi:hypothetical protein [Nostoc sp. DedQUE02]|uniref:hypothetical protein n=1 Tax=Nostoc sp. DedQUE02 TaxID=3075388 RepID=UPI0039199789